MTVAIIPCRSGSVSVKDKNIRLLNGKHLMAYAIEAAKSAKKVTRVIVSTDSKIYADIADTYGAEVMFRPKILAEDVPTELVIQNLMTPLMDMRAYGLDDIVVTLQCTTPLMLPDDIDACIKKMDIPPTYNSVITVTECSEHPEWMYHLAPVPIGSFPYLVPYAGDEVFGSRGVRQSLSKLYRPNGAVYVTRLNTLFHQNRIIGKYCGYVEMPRLRSIDIDSEEDFKLLEAIIKAGLV